MDQVEEEKDNLNSKLVIYPILDLVNNLNSDHELKFCMKEYERVAHANIKNNQKFSVLRHMGNFFEGLNDVFNIDSVYFSQYQDDMTRLNEYFSTNKLDVDTNLSLITNVSVFLRYSTNGFKESEIFNKEISTENLEGLKISFVEFDEKFCITKKFTIGELKFKACQAFNILLEDYIVVSQHFDWWPYSVNLYDEVFNKNMQKGYVELTSRFFQMNPLVTVNFINNEK